MKTLHSYLLRQIIATLAMTVMVFTLVFLLGSVLQELLPLLMSRQAPLGVFAQAIGLLIPFVGAFALPIALLAATLLVFGRFSADQELTAARASGVSLISLITPILILSLVLCAVCGAVNLQIAPRCRVAYNQLRFRVRSVVLSQFQLPEGQPVLDFKDYVIRVEKNRNRQLQDILLYKLKDGTNLEWTVRAPRGDFAVDSANQKIILHLRDGIWVSGEMPSSFRELTYDLPLAPSSSMGKPGITDMTFGQLQRELRERERRYNFQPRISNASDLTAQQRELRRFHDDLTEPVRVQIHKQIAFSFACFGFALVGIPLGIQVHRRETNIGMAIALGLVAIYYALMIIADSLSAHPAWAPHLWMWLPNFVFQAAGAVLLRRANRGI